MKRLGYEDKLTGSEGFGQDKGAAQGTGGKQRYQAENLETVRLQPAPCCRGTMLDIKQKKAWCQHALNLDIQGLTEERKSWSEAPVQGQRPQ